MLKIIQRYLAYNFISPFILSTLFFVVFLLTFQLFRVIRIVINKGVEVVEIFELVGHIAISFLPMAIPLSVLFAAIFTLNKLSEDSEIVAMRSFGIKKGTLMAPFMIVGFFVASTIFVLNRNLIPYSKTQFKNTIIRLTNRGMLTDIKAGHFFTDIPKVTLFAEEVEDGGSKMQDVFIRLDKGNEEQVIMAKRGVLIKQKLGELLTPSLRLHLMDGNITKTETKSGRELEKVIFKEYDFPVVSGGQLPGFVTKDTMRSNSELRRVIKAGEKRKLLLERITQKTQEEKWELDNLRRGLPKSKLEFWSRWNTPLQVLVFILLGFSLGIKKGRGRTRNSGALSLIILGGYYALFFGGVSLARKGNFPPELAVFIPTILATVVGINLYRKLDWMS